MADSGAGAIPAAHASSGDWRRVTGWLLGTAAILYLLGLGFLLAVDPYDTGRTGLLGKRGLPEQLPHSANASRARDPHFDSAIFGNSHVQLLKPERLDALTGLRFVNLMMPGSYPSDQLDTLRWYLTVQKHPRAVVIGADEFWCFETDTERSSVFPVWLYAPDFARYLGGLASYHNLRWSLKRLAYLRSGRGGIRPDGYWDYTGMFAPSGPRADALRRSLEEPSPYRANASGRFPALDRLAHLVRRVPAETAIILLRPPAYHTAIPAPDTPAGRIVASCRERMREIAASHPRARLLDLFGPSPESNDPDNFYDWFHFRDGLAVAIERQIVAALRETEPSAAASGPPPGGARP